MNSNNRYLTVFFGMLSTFCFAQSNSAEPPIPEKYKTFLEEHRAVPVSPSLEKKLTDIKKLIESPEYKTRSHEIDTRVKAIMLEKATGKRPTNTPEADSEAPILSNAAVLFVSQSIPIEVLRRYANDLAKVRGVMVFRGFQGDLKKIGPTMRFMGEITKLDPSCKGSSCKNLNVNILIDPQLFRDNRIQQVPALTFIPEMNLGSYCKRDDDGGNNNVGADIAFGDSSLLGLLSALNEMRRDTRIEKMIKKLEGAT